MAKSWIPVVKGIHFLPISYFGNYPNPPENGDRLTIPEIQKCFPGRRAAKLKKRISFPGLRAPLCSFMPFTC